MGTGVLLAALAVLWTSRGTGRTPGNLDRRGGSTAGIVALSGGAALTAIWWLVMSGSSHPRHLVMALLVLVVMGALGAVHLCRLPSTHPWLRVSLAALLTAFLATSVTMRTIEAWHVPGVSAAEQDRAGRAISETGASSTRFQGWWQNPEVRLLSGIPSRRLDRTGGLLVLDPLQRALDRSTWRKSADLCDQTLYERDGYVVCWVVSQDEPRTSGD